MILKEVIAVIGFLFMPIASYSQVVSKDSINVLYARKEMLGIGKKLNECRLELARLENQLQEKTAQVNQTAETAQRSADENKEAAIALEKDSQDRKLARQAKRAARKAHRDAKKARKAEKRHKDLTGDIESLKNKVAEYEAQLATLKMP
ncbi:hypothetical protein [Dyadobacter sp. LHD-138]|uniref:hypothetical protein n=1 Tax=Dyadobacter sp. LHD-138 TaxID=3071413 RepID=UPI0027DF5CD0|nr:hypothetical protein [Dyadobacter sp. LHD-138]MDQ6480562.1 hypothetical protein [Dyadobacter sp. LHD-138]